MKKLIVFILMTIMGFAGKNAISTQYTSFTYGAYPNNHFLSVYLNLEDLYSFYAGDLDLRIGVNALGALQKSDDFQLFDTITKNRILIHSLSLDYYPTPELLFSAGRQAMKLNLLQGSFDGLLAVGKYDDFSIQAFYFNHYSVLYPSYYVSTDVDDLYGFNLHYDKDLLEAELSYFSYDDHKVSDIYLALHMQDITIGLEHLSLTSDTLSDEKAYKGYIGYQYQNLYTQLGYYHVYEGTLGHIFDLGGSEFQHFRLHGFLDRHEAKNLYIDLTYKRDGFYANLYIGRTEFIYDWNPDKLYTNKELGISIGKTFDNIELSTTLLTQKSDEDWFAGNRTTWVQTQLKMRF
jgi:hypothetical protein